ncbi:hypothetical protein MRS44_018018 [Fusarium solani]|uniref:uncharacterized protein n=1 Tax=Fusarium solani TaxID=169388 RepID=UPI0032C3FA73|nr:hypothetical protein MRS44_018018 [Fusarium solani]
MANIPRVAWATAILHHSASIRTNTDVAQNFIALPLAFLIGKRYTIIISLVVFLAANIWSGEAQSYQSLRSARILGGMAGGMIEALAPTIVTETFPKRQLARAMVVYVGFLAIGAALGPIISGAVAQGLGEWRWFQRVMSIAVAVNLVLLNCAVMLGVLDEIKVIIVIVMVRAP